MPTWRAWPGCRPTKTPTPEPRRLQITSDETSDVVAVCYRALLRALHDTEYHVGVGEAFLDSREAFDTRGRVEVADAVEQCVGVGAKPRGVGGEQIVEGGTDATDQTPTGGVLLNRGHGTGTLGILAGGYHPDLLAVPANFGPIGGAPFATVVPVRVANSVVHFGTSAVARGIDYAREIGADVLSMSMGGLPSDAWADAVNAAYEAGVVLVCAAGNSFAGLPTSLIVYPARFNRVIAACGVMAAGHPYYGFQDLGKMEGCAGPMGKMNTALAAYTPNTPWARLGRANIVDMDGAGTSSATPQVAAACAAMIASRVAISSARRRSSFRMSRAGAGTVWRMAGESAGATPRRNNSNGSLNPRIIRLTVLEKPNLRRIFLLRKRCGRTM